MRRRLNPICKCAYNSPVAGSVRASLAHTLWGMPRGFYHTQRTCTYLSRGGCFLSALRLTLIASRCYKDGGCGYCPNSPYVREMERQWRSEEEHG